MLMDLCIVMHHNLVIIFLQQKHPTIVYRKLRIKLKQNCLDLGRMKPAQQHIKKVINGLDNCSKFGIKER